MDLFLELSFSVSTGERRVVDVAVEVEPTDTVGSLVEALAAHAGRWGLGVRAADGGTAGLALSRGDDQLSYDPGIPIADTGLVSGDRVTLRSPSPGTAQQPGTLTSVRGLMLHVVAGPEAGRVVPLPRGRVTVGRSPSCDVVLNDLTVSREHFTLHVGDGDLLSAEPNPDAKNATVVGDLPLTGPHDLRLDQPIHAGASVLAVRRAESEATRRRDRLGLVAYNRVPYRRAVVRQRHFDDLAAPPAVPGKRRISIAMALSPLAMSGGLAIMTGRYYFLVLALLSPVLLVFRQVSKRREGKRSFVREKAAFAARTDGRAAEVTAALEDERRTRFAAAPDLADLACQARYHLPRLWERNRSAGDALSLRLGLGDLPSQVVAAIARGGDDDLRDEGEARLAHQTTVLQVPVTVNLIELGTLGLSGEPDWVAAVGRMLVVQAACLHSPEDMVVAAALGERNVSGFEWLKWLPHVSSATSPLEGEHVAVGPDQSNSLLVNLLAVAQDRAARSRPGAGPVWPRLLLVLDETAEIDRALLSRLLDVAPTLGIHTVWLGHSSLQVPRQCQAVLGCAEDDPLARLRFTDPDHDEMVVCLDGASPDTARSIACSLAPLRDASTSSQTTAIPRVVPLLDVLPVDAPLPDAIAQQWTMPRAYGLEFEVGLAADGPFTLDLVHQGPHTLIGGTSGSGKSELLQAMVLSLAAQHSPSRLNFLLIDYKGGASSAELRALPHSVGYVTNLSGRLSVRALTSLRAELKRRMQLMEGRAKDLAEMLSVAPEEAPPSLVIVVDEFAALVKEVPDFVAGVVDIAQRGRSLGIHLVLATQRPTGVVNDNILANTNLRIALRMLDPADSSNIIGTRDAADIPAPLRGRAYARTDAHTLVPFQSAWSSAPLSSDTQRRDVVVRPFALVRSDGAPAGDAGAEEVTGGGTSPPEALPLTHTDALLDACGEAARRLELPPARRPWLEPLGDVVTLADVARIAPSALRAGSGDPGRDLVLGLYDDPENQAQHAAVVDLESSGGLIVFGTGGSGKTTLLRTAAVALAQQGSPEEVRIYGLDFASRGLDVLADLPHCGAMVPGDDLERVTRLMTLLGREVDRRRELLAEARVENLGSLRARTGEPTMPRIVVLVDSYGGFHSTFEQATTHAWVIMLQRLVSNGRQVGVHFVFTTERRMGTPSALLSAISARLALRMATPEELAALGVPVRLAKGAELPNGRGFLDGAIEVQVACVSRDHSGAAQAEAVARIAAELTAEVPTRAPELPELPAVVAIDGSSPALTAPLAVVDLTLDRVDVDLRRQHLVVTGPPMSGKSTALATVAQGLRASTGAAVSLLALGGASSPLAGLDLWDAAAFARGRHAELVTKLLDELADSDRVEARVVLFVDAAEDVEGTDVLRPLEALTKRDALRLVVACDPVTISKAYSGWMSALRRHRSALFLQPESRIDVESAIGVKPQLRPGQELPPGRGVFVANRRWSLVQVGHLGTAPQ